MADERNITARFTADTSGFSPRINELVQKLKAFNQEFERNRQEIAQLNAQIRTYQQELTRISADARNSGGATAEQSRRMEELRSNISQCADRVGTLRTAQRQLSHEINTSSRELSEERDAMQETSDAASVLGDVLKANIISDAVQGGIRKTAELLKGAAAYCYQVGSAFEAGMSRVGAVSGAGGEDLEMLTQKAKQLGETTKFSASEASEAMNYMAMAGWDAQQMMSGIGGVLDLAAAAGEDLGITSDIVTDAISAFGLSAEDVGHFADVLAAASSNANTNVAMMGETFQYCAPIAGALGFSIDEVAEAIGIMANSGIKSSMAGTALRTTLTNLSEGVTIAGDSIGEVTIQTSNADGSMRNLNEILDELRGTFSLLSESEKASAAESVAGKYAMSGFLALMNAGADDVGKLRAAIEECDGAAANMAQTMGDNLQGKITILKSAAEGLGIEIYDAFSGGLTDGVEDYTDGISDMTEKLRTGKLGESIDKLADSVSELLEDGAEFAAGVLPDIVGSLADFLSWVIDCREEIGALITAVVTFKAAFTLGKLFAATIADVVKLKAAFLALKTEVGSTSAALKTIGSGIVSSINPVTAVITAIAAAVAAVSAAVVEYNAHIEDCNDKMKSYNNAAGEMIENAKEYKKQSEDLYEIAEEYDKIAKSVEGDAEKKAELKELQADLIDSFGSEAEGIDLVNGSYKEQLGLLQDIAEEKRKKAEDEANDAREFLNKAENEGVTIRFGNDVDMLLGSGDNEAEKKVYNWAIENMNAADGSQFLEKAYDGHDVKNVLLSGGSPLAYAKAAFADNSIHFAGSYEDQITYLERLRDKAREYDATDLMDRLQDKIDELEEQAAIVEKYEAMLSGNDVEPISFSYTAYEEQLKGEAERDKAARMAAADKLSDEQKKTNYAEEKQLADDMYGVGEMSAQEYYDRLTELRDTYLENGSHDWYVATKEIKSLAEKLGEGLVEGAESAADGVKEQLSEIEQAYRDTIAAIDAEIERHNRKKQDEEMQGQINEVKARLEYEHLDDFQRYEIEKELKRLEEEQQETQWKRDMEDKKDAAKYYYDQAKNAGDALTSASGVLEDIEVADRDYIRAREGYTAALDEYAGAMDTARAMLGESGTLYSQTSYSTTNNVNSSVNIRMPEMMNYTLGQITNTVVAAVKKAISSDL